MIASTSTCPWISPLSRCPTTRRCRLFSTAPIVLAGDLGAEGLTEERICNHQGPDTRSAPLSVRGLRSGGKRPEDWIKPANSPGDFVIDDGGARIQLRPLNRLWGRFATYWTVS